MTYRVRHNGKKVNLFDRFWEIRKQLSQVLPEIEAARLISMLCHCRRFYEGNLYYGRRTSEPEEKRKREQLRLTEPERLLYEFMLRRKINPSTTYRWFLATRVPEDVKNKLAKGQISYQQAMQISYNRKRVRDSNMGMPLFPRLSGIRCSQSLLCSKGSGRLRKN